MGPIWETSSVRLLQALTKDGGWQQNLAVLCNELYDEEAVLYVGHLNELFEVGRDHITAIGFSPKHGARPLQRAVERHVVGALYRLLIDEDMANACIVSDFDGEVVLTVR